MAHGKLFRWCSATCTFACLFACCVLFGIELVLGGKSFRISKWDFTTEVKGGSIDARDCQMAEVLITMLFAYWLHAHSRRWRSAVDEEPRGIKVVKPCCYCYF
jgi:hypothetical protein